MPMVKIINGSKYDADAAIEVGCWDNGLSGDDASYVRETLCRRKRANDYFLLGVGGAFTRYAKRDGDMMRGGCDIVPITDDEAKALCEKHLSVEAYEREFGTTEEADDRYSVTMKFYRRNDYDVIAWLEAQSNAQGAIKNLIRAELKKA